MNKGTAREVTKIRQYVAMGERALAARSMAAEMRAASLRDLAELLIISVQIGMRDDLVAVNGTYVSALD